MNLFKQIKNLATDSTGSGVTQNWYITAERAEGLKDKDTFSKSDPYLKIEFAGKRERTRTIKNDRSPAWNETFNFKVNSSSVRDIQISLTDDDFGLDDTIGTGVVSKGDLPTHAGEEKTFKVPVYRKEQVCGIVHLRVKQVVDGQPSNYQSNYQSSNIPSSNYSQQPQQSQQPMYNQPQQHYYNPQQQPMYNQPPIYSQPPMYNQSQPYQNQNQNQYPQGQGQAPPNMNQPYNSYQPNQQHQQPYSNQQQYNPNYRQ